MVRPIAALTCCLVVGRVASSAEAHPLHTSYTEIARERNGTISMSIRVFADDFGALLDSLRPLSATGTSTDDVARQYVERSVTLSTRDGRLVRLSWCGMRSEKGLTWVCARSAEPVPVGTLRLRNAMMFDRFADQVSIVRWYARSSARTVVLSARSPSAALE